MDTLSVNPAFAELIKQLSGAGKIFSSVMPSDTCFENLILIEFSNESQYDLLIDFHDKFDLELPDGLLSIAGSGNKFHGWRKRPWKALKGNIHLSVYLRPEREIKHFGAAFLSLSAVSVVNTLDELLKTDSKASIKWVNDVFVDDAKICGFLANSQLRGNSVTSVVLGIGLNVLAEPDIEPTAYVPATTAMNKHIAGKQISESEVFVKLIGHLSDNYQKILKGEYDYLYNEYYSRSAVIGRYAEIYTDLPDGTDILSHSGLANTIGKDLELYLENNDKPITAGRLVLK